MTEQRKEVKQRKPKPDITADEWCTEEGLILLECWKRNGMSQDDIASNMGITRKTLCEWKNKRPEIREALRRGKEVVDFQVENALLKAALGYKYTEVKTYISGNQDKNGNRTVKIEKTEKEVGPNVTACLAWLNNRKSNDWRRNRDNEIELKDENSNITINIIKGKNNEEENVNDDEWEGIDTEDDEWNNIED